MSDIIIDTFEVNVDFIKFAIGKNGSCINNIKEVTNCKIFNRNGGPIFTIEGLPENVWNAKQKIVTATLTGHLNDHQIGVDTSDRPGTSGQSVNRKTIGSDDFFVTTGWITKASDLRRSVVAIDDSIRREQDNFITSLPYGALKEDWMCRNDPEKLSKIIDNFTQEMRINPDLGDRILYHLRAEESLNSHFNVDY